MAFAIFDPPPLGFGVDGVAVQDSIRFLREHRASGYGDVQTLAKAVRTAADLGATVINVSSVACLAVADVLDDRALGAALAYAVDVRNAVVVTAAGNVGGPGQCPAQNPMQNADWDRVESVASPAWYDDLVLTVGSVMTAFAGSLAELLAYRFVAGAGAAVTLVVGQAMAAAIPGPYSRGRAISLYHAAFLAAKQTPVFFGSAVNNFGVMEVLDALVDLAPAPQARKSTAIVNRQPVERMVEAGLWRLFSQPPRPRLAH